VGGRESQRRLLRGGGKYLGTATLPLHIAAEEAWMSINPVHVTAARLRLLLNTKEYSLGGGP
jgi:hypothetical protein